jgi:hypothetical protein
LRQSAIYYKISGLLLLFLILFVFVLVANSIPRTAFAQNNLAQGGNSFLSYQNPIYGIKMIYPSDWEKIDMSTSDLNKAKASISVNNIVAFSAPRESTSDLHRESLIVTLLNLPSFMQNMPLSEEIPADIYNLKRSSQDFQLIDSSPTILSGKDAYRIIYTQTDRNSIIKTMEIFSSINGDKQYSLMFVAEQSKFSLYLPIIQKMINAFEIS